MSHAVQPGWEHLSGFDRGGLAEQDDKNRLERVFRVLMAEQTPADAPYHRAMALDQSGEGRLIPPLHKTGKQLRIGQA